MLIRACYGSQRSEQKKLPPLCSDLSGNWNGPNRRSKERASPFNTAARTPHREQDLGPKQIGHLVTPSAVSTRPIAWTV